MQYKKIWNNIMIIINKYEFANKKIGVTSRNYFSFSNCHQFFKHIHILIVSDFKLHCLCEIKSVPPENMRSTCTVEPF